MNQSPSPSRSQPGAEAAQARFGMRVAAALTEHQRGAPNPDVEARLSFAHNQALSAAREARGVTAAAQALVGAVGSSAVLGGGPDFDATPWWLRLGSLLPLALLLAGLMLIDSRYTRSQIDAAAEVDAAILADDLPPEAYRDRGFVEFLKTARP